jgi:hypothetical protein
MSGLKYSIDFTFISGDKSLYLGLSRILLLFMGEENCLHKFVYQTLPIFGKEIDFLEMIVQVSRYERLAHQLY